MPDATLLDCLRAHAARAPEALALLAPERPPLTYAGLLAQTERTADALASFGVRRGDRVAVVLPNGPEMAVTCLGAAAAAACAPLNPGYRAPEFEFYLSDLQAKALIVPEGSESPAVSVARALGIAVLELAPNLEQPAGAFTLHGARPPQAAPQSTPEPDHTALLLHTSGTTARPKLVALTQRNLALSAGNVGQSLALTPQDRGLNVMPLFHIHGLVAGLLAPLAAGGSVVATPGFDAPRFFDWLAEFAATWYTAVPAMHQAVLARAAHAGLSPFTARLRFVRSSSASLPPQVLAGLEQVFSAPVMEAYGMTEAAHQMASNPLPPRPRKPRSVGLAAGPEIAIMAPGSGDRLPPDGVGEVVIRGPNVMPGYANNPTANREAFAHGWFHTGDQGYLDADGYLFLTGRLKELINRGGEKVAPVEVEEVLLDHPAVAQAAVFALPDARLGEAVGAAVVVRAGRLPDERELRRFVAARLAGYKVPARIVMVAALPTGATGKVLRLGMAARLGLSAAEEPAAPAPYAPPENETESVLAALWQTVLRRERVGRHDRFLDLGGDSLLATQLVGRVADAFGVELSLLDFFDAPTVAEQAVVVGLLAQLRSAGGGEASSLAVGSL